MSRNGNDFDPATKAVLCGVGILLAVWTLVLAADLAGWFQ